MNFLWDDFPKQFQESIILNVVRLQSNMNPIDTGTLLWSLGQLDVKLDVESKYFFNAILAITIMNLDKMKAQELTRTIWGYSGTGISWNMLPYDIQWYELFLIDLICYIYNIDTILDMCITYIYLCLLLQSKIYTI